MPKTGLAVIGLGMAAKPHAKALNDLADRVAVRGVYSPNPERRSAFAEAYGFEAAASVADLANDPEVTAVLLITPPNARAELVRMFADAGKHILMEKPVERTTAEAEKLVRYCEEAGVSLGIVFQHRYRAGTRKLKTLLENKSLGEIAAVQAVIPWWRPQSYYDEPGRGTLARDGGGVLISQAIHTLDLMLSMTGPVDEVQAVAGTSRLHDMETEDFVSAGLRFESGALGALIASTASYPGASEYLVLDCELASARFEAGTLTIHWRDGRTDSYGDVSATGGGADPMDFPHDWHRDLVSDFLDAIETGREPTVSGREALEVHYLIDAILTSSRERRATKVERNG